MSGEVTKIIFVSGRNFFYLTCRVKPIHAGKLNIEQDHVGLQQANLLKCFDSVYRFANDFKSAHC